jgi:DNA-binding MarR family transcriptional regulator
MGSNASGRGRGASGAETQEVLDAIRAIVQALRESSRAAEKDVGLSGAQLFVLRALADAPGLSLNDLAERTRTHQSSVSALATRLAAAGMIERGTAAGDGRRAELRLSAAGRRRLKRAPHAAQERLVAAVDAMAAADRARLGALLGGVVRAMGLRARRPAMFFEDPPARGRRNGRADG